MYVVSMFCKLLKRHATREETTIEGETSHLADFNMNLKYIMLQVWPIIVNILRATELDVQYLQNYAYLKLLKTGLLLS